MAGGYRLFVMVLTMRAEQLTVMVSEFPEYSRKSLIMSSKTSQTSYNTGNA